MFTYLKKTGYLFCCLLALSISCFGQKLQTSLYFDTGESSLNASHRETLRKLWNEIPVGSETETVLSAYADTVGNAQPNQELSAKRAENTQAYWVKLGVDPQSILTNAYGETRSNGAKDNAEARRVDIEVRWKSPKLNTTIRDLFALTKLKADTFCVNTERDTILRAQNGTLVQVKARSFQINGKLVENPCVKVVVKEAFEPWQMIMENLSTVTTDNQLLQTQGMVEVQGYIGKDSISLTKPVTIMIPTDEETPEAKVFDGLRDPSTDVMEWEVNEGSVLGRFSITEINDCYTPEGLYKYGGYIQGFYDYYNNCLANCIQKIDSLNEGIADSKYCFLKGYRRPKGEKGKGFFPNYVRKKELNGIQRKLREGFNSNPLTFSMKAFAEDLKKINFTSQARLKELAKLQEQLRKTDSLITSFERMPKQKFVACEKLDSLLKVYQVDNVNELSIAINRPLMDKLGVNTLEGLRNALPRINEANLEMAYRNKSITYSDYKYYVFQTSTLGWKNIDIFTDLPPDQMVALQVDLYPALDTDVKLVLPNRQFVLSGEPTRSKYSFPQSPLNEEAWIVALKYENGIPQLGMRKIQVAEKTYSIKLETLSLEMLREKLKVIQFD